MRGKNFVISNINLTVINISLLKRIIGIQVHVTESWYPHSFEIYLTLPHYILFGNEVSGLGMQIRSKIFVQTAISSTITMELGSGQVAASRTM